MRSSLIVILSVLALLSVTQAYPSFRRLQQNVTVVQNETSSGNTTTTPNTTVVSNTSNSTNTSTTTNPYPGYTALTLSEVENSTVANGAFLHAMNAVVQTAIAQGKIPVSVYNVSNLTGAWVRNRRGGATYIFNAQLVGANRVNFACNVTVYHNNAANTNRMTAYHYRATNIQRSLFPTNSYRFLTPAQVHNNTVVQGALVYGAKTMIEWLVNQNKIPAQNLNYTIYNLYFAAYRRSNAGTSYKFQINAANDDGVTVRTNYTVFYRNSNKTYTQTAYWYRAYGFSRSELANTTNSTGNNSNVTTPNVTVVDNSTSTDNSTVDVPEVTPNVTVVDNSTTTSNSTGNVTASNATTGSNSTAGAPVNVTENAVNVNVNATLVTMDNTTSTTTALVNLNYPAASDNTTLTNGTETSGSSGNVTLPSNPTVVDNTTVLVNGNA